MCGVCAVWCRHFSSINWDTPYASLDLFYCQIYLYVNYVRTPFCGLFFCSDLPVIRYAISYASHFLCDFCFFFFVAENKQNSTQFFGEVNYRIRARARARTHANVSPASYCTYFRLYTYANCTCNNFIWHWDAEAVWAFGHNYMTESSCICRTKVEHIQFYEMFDVIKNDSTWFGATRTRRKRKETVSLLLNHFSSIFFCSFLSFRLAEVGKLKKKKIKNTYLHNLSRSVQIKIIYLIAQFVYFLFAPIRTIRRFFF